MVATNPHALELIQIASPCTADWDAMAGDERMRHCSQCNLNVFNLSDMTRDEATAFVAAREGRTCVRMFKRSDGTVITRDCPVGIAAVRAKFVRLTLATVGLLVALSATALAAISRAPVIRNYLSQGKLDRLHQKNQVHMVQGGICPPPLINPVPNPGISSSPPELLGEIAPPPSAPQ
jgi:hypothetical protein